MAKQSRYIVETRSAPIDSVISDAFTDIGDLADEMGEWRDSLEDKFSGTDKYQTVSDTADTLEEHREEPDNSGVSKLLDGVEISYGEMVLRRKKSRSGPSRSTRLSNCSNRLGAAIGYLEERTDEEGLSDDDKTALEEYRDELQGHLDEIDSVEFPGMFG
jgi:hypothetical protein